MLGASVDHIDELVGALLRGEARTRDDVIRLKARLCRKHRLARVPANYEILERVPKERREEIEPLLRNKPVRTLSGVAPVAVMTSPCECPHGRCSYCPGGVSIDTPQSYTGHEPAALRAIMYEFDPYMQTKARIDQLRSIGHPTDKVDLIIMGGTFTSRSLDYQDWFVKRCFDAMNGCFAPDLASAQESNEAAAHRCVGLTVETRPDWFRDGEVGHSLVLGATKVELGAQILDDVVLASMRRGHTVQDLVDATRRSKNAGLKLCYHLMPGLPGTDSTSDLESFKRVFEDERFRPDMLKIYPTLVVAGTELHDAWKKGLYEPMSLDRTVELLAEAKRMVPPWVRILRIQRDIPVKKIEAGVTKSHLREIVLGRLREEGGSCRCIRCREVGHARLGKAVAAADAEFVQRTYDASGGKELFISFEIPPEDVLVGYARLRLPRDGAGNWSLLRELHVYGQMVPIGERMAEQWQHKGFGERLLARCEELTAEHGLEVLRTMSGVGARGYYRRFGYERDGPYMSKRVNKA